MTDDSTWSDDGDGPRPNPRPEPRPGAGGDTTRDVARPKPARRQIGRPSPTPRPGPRVDNVAGIGPVDEFDPTEAVRVVLGERVLVGAGGPSLPTEATSVFALDDSFGPVEPFDLDHGDDWARLPRRGGWLRRALIVVAVLAVVVTVTGVEVGRWVHAQVHPAGPHGTAVAFTIEQGQSTNLVANNLATKHVIGNATVFRYWLRRQGGDQKFKAGDYDLFTRMDYPELLTALRAGPKPPVQIKVTIPPGFTVAQLQKALLDKLPGFNATELTEALKNPRLDAGYAPPVFGIREGLLFPDTYNVDEDASSNTYALLRRMRDQMDKVLKELNADSRASALHYSTYDILKVASLIEKEAKVDGDRAKIARVIYNRLDKQMALGIDASTRFAVGKTNGEPLTASDLASESAYNTRKAVGLPPTPIAMPSRASIEAALSPTPNQPWLYYVLTDDAGVKGAHTFVTSPGEFEAARKICQAKGYCD